MDSSETNSNTPVQAHAAQPEVADLTEAVQDSNGILSPNKAAVKIG